MKTLQTKWAEIADELEFLCGSDQKRTDMKCDVLAFYDLLDNGNVPETIADLARSVRMQVSEYECDLVEGTLMKRYFHWLDSFDRFDLDDIGILISDRIDVETMQSYARCSNYICVQAYDAKLAEVFKINFEAFTKFRNLIFKNRGVKIHGEIRVPIQYETVLNLKDAA